jgi:DNA-binding MarR family transcriptional regulator
MSRLPSEQPTAKQLRVLRYILAHVERHGFQPSQREIAQHFGLTDNAVLVRLKGLERHGLVELSGGARERAVVLRHVRFRVYFSKEP